MRCMHDRVWMVWAGGKERERWLIDVTVAFRWQSSSVTLTLLWSHGFCSHWRANKFFSVQLYAFFNSDFSAFAQLVITLWICFKGHHLLSLVFSLLWKTDFFFLKNVGSWTVLVTIEKKKKNWHFSKCCLLCFIEIYCLKTSLDILFCVAQVNVSYFKDLDYFNGKQFKRLIKLSLKLHFFGALNILLLLSLRVHLMTTNYKKIIMLDCSNWHISLNIILIRFQTTWVIFFIRFLEKKMNVRFSCSEIGKTKMIWVL